MCEWKKMYRDAKEWVWNGSTTYYVILNITIIIYLYIHSHSKTFRIQKKKIWIQKLSRFDTYKFKHWIRNGEYFDLIIKSYVAFQWLTKHCLKVETLNCAKEWKLFILKSLSGIPCATTQKYTILWNINRREKNKTPK